MKCSKVFYKDYRNIEDTEVAFSDGINVLWGNNAQGKSNILEGIYLFARGKSFRGAKDRELIRFGADFARLTMLCTRDGAKHDTKIEVTIPQDGRKRITRGGARITPAEMIGSFRAVLFCPAHLTLVGGGPAERRAFLDVAISQLSGEYIELLTRYQRALTQRNALIKSAADGAFVSNDQWSVYAEQLAAYGAGIASMRLSYIGQLSEKMKAYFYDMTDGRETPTLSYVSHALPEGEAKPDDVLSGFLEANFTHAGRERMIRSLTDNIDREIAAKTTLHGVHKDDIVLSLNGREARLYASQGQQRSIALSMKLAEGEISRTATGEYPVFLLDDVLSELDAERRAFVLGALSDRQIIVTSCEPSLFNDSGSAAMFRIDGGTATRL